MLGATSESLEMSGGLLPMQNWYAPALNAAHEAGVADWDVADVVALLKTGQPRRAARSAGQPRAVVMSGGFTPSTAGHPRPFGMPPFGPELDDAQIAAVATCVRAAWGNAASPVSRLHVVRYRWRRTGRGARPRRQCSGSKESA